MSSRGRSRPERRRAAMADVAADRKSAAASFASDDNLEKVFSDQPLGDPAEAARCEKALDRALSRARSSHALFCFHARRHHWRGMCCRPCMKR